MYFCIGLIVGPRPAVLAFGFASDQYTKTWTNNKDNTEILAQ